MLISKDLIGKSIARNSDQKRIFSVSLSNNFHDYRQLTSFLYVRVVALFSFHYAPLEMAT